MQTALIGYTGFVGETLQRQMHFDAMYRSTNISDIDGGAFDMVVCAGAPAQKWIANRDPASDCQNIESLIEHLKTIRCKTFILISTIDVFANPIEVDEQSSIEEDSLHAYGLHRRLLEKFVASHFPDHLIVRLPGLVGAGLRKNVIYDFLNDNNLHAIDSRGVFQFYPMEYLWRDIEIARCTGLKTVHLTAAPVSVAEMALHGFGKKFEQHLNSAPAMYDMRTLHAAAFDTTGAYQYSREQSLDAIRKYAGSEPKRLALPKAAP